MSDDRQKRRWGIIGITTRG